VEWIVYFALIFFNAPSASRQKSLLSSVRALVRGSTALGSPVSPRAMHLYVRLTREDFEKPN